MQKIERNITVSANSVAKYEAVARAGFWGVDVRLAPYNRRDEVLTGEYENEIMGQYRTLCSLGLQVGQTHLTYWPAHIPPVGDGSFDALAEYLIPMLQREIEITANMGCRVAVMHPFFVQDGTREESRAGNMKFIEALLPLLERCGVTLALENIYGHALSDAHHETTDDFLYYTEKFRSPYIGVCLDTGHACVRGQDPIAMAQELGRHLQAVHIHASVHRKDSHAIPCITNGDSVDWPLFGRTLDEIGFSGNFNLEIRPPRILSDAAQDAYYQLAYSVARELTQ